MTQFRHTIQQHHLHMKSPVRLSHINLYHCDSSPSDIFPGYPYAKIIFVQQGHGQLIYGDSRLGVQTGTLVLMNPERQRFSLQIDSDSVDVVILGVENTGFTRDGQTFTQPYLIHSGQEHNYAFFINKIIDELHTKAPSFEDACNHYLELLLISMQRDTEITCNSFIEDKSNQDCQNIKEYLDEHFSENITLDTLSEKSGMNKYYLVHSFTKQYLRSPISYLNEKRIDESKKLLENTDHSIAEIAQLIGFSSQSYFSQAFKKKTLMTPNEYRHSVKRRF